MKSCFLKSLITYLTIATTILFTVVHSTLFDLGSFYINIYEASLNPLITISYKASGKVIWETAPSLPFLQYATAVLLQPPILNGNYQVNEDVTIKSEYVSIDTKSLDFDKLTICGKFFDSSKNIVNNCGYCMYFNQVPADGFVSNPSIFFNVTTTSSCYPSDDPRLFLQYASVEDENFYGFGESFSYFNLKGRNVPILVSEQGLGRGEEPITSFENDKTPGVGGYWYTTYAPKAIYVTNHNRSVFIDIPETMFVDLTVATAVRVECWASSIRGKIYFGRSWLELVEAITADTGRQRALPSWSQKGAVVGLEGGTKNVSRIVKTLVHNNVPVAGVWLQDWVGLRHSPIDGDRLIWNWEVNYDWYPGWQDMVGGWANEGIRVLTYINPFFSDPTNFTATVRQNFFKEGIEKGFFVKNQNGEPYRMHSLTIEFCMIDPTNPEAVEWMVEIIKNYTIAEGLSSGWMCDFGEYLPFDAVLFDGSDPASFHNVYPQAWSEITMKAIVDVNREDDILFFSRSAWTRSPKSVPVFWLGDQLISWDANDGIKTVITGALSSGLTGQALTHSDIGGYNVVFNLGPDMYYVRTPELLKRWSELAAFGSALYRTHIGSSTTLLDAQCYDTTDSMAHFGEFAEIFGNLSLYRSTLFESATAKGYPLIRPLALHYFWDSNIWSAAFNTDNQQMQYLFGEDFIVAPALNEGQTTTNIYLPSYSGKWIHLWSGTVIDAGSSGRWLKNVPSGIGFPCVFYRVDSATGQQLSSFVILKGYTKGYEWSTEESSGGGGGGWEDLGLGVRAAIVVSAVLAILVLIYFAKYSYDHKHDDDLENDSKRTPLYGAEDRTYSAVHDEEN